jgi:Tol biopolymer transport system component
MGGAGGAMWVDSGAPPPGGTGASGAAGTGPDPVLDAGSEFDAGPVPTCFDTLQNQDEAGIDCGGASCIPCPCTFGVPQQLGNPNASGNDLWSPSLSNDGLAMYFSLSTPGFNERVAVATRSSRGAAFSAGSALPTPVNSSTAGTPELSANGLALYFFSQRFDGTGDRDLYVATRSSTALQFGAVTELTTVNSTRRDDRPWVAPDELTLYFTSQRSSLTDDLWRATRNARSDPFGMPVAVTELNSTGNDSGLYSTPDGKVVYFASDRSGGGGGVDIYRAVRASTSSAFSTPELLSALSSGADDFDPQLTADGQELFFASTRSGGVYRIWRSLVTCP